MSDRLSIVGTENIWAPRNFSDYKTTIKRNPNNDLVLVRERLGEVTGPVFGESDLGGLDNNLTLVNDGEAVGQRILVHGKVLGWDGKPVPNTLIEIWQANAGGRYRHKNDTFEAPLDPHFNGWGERSRMLRGTTAFTRSSRAHTRGATTTTPGVLRTSTFLCTVASSESAWSRRCTSRMTRCSSRTRSTTPCLRVRVSG